MYWFIYESNNTQLDIIWYIMQCAIELYMGLVGEVLCAA